VAGIIDYDEISGKVQALNAAFIMTKYMVKFETMSMILKLQANASVQQVSVIIIDFTN